MEFEPVIGLEVHAQLKTRTKIFCRCSTEFGAPPNTHTCPVCLGMPGVLPVLNRRVVEYTIKMALATSCGIAAESRFARKNYFYPDLPKNYQISQYEAPIAEKGHVDISIDGKTKTIGITRIHMEEDAGKLIHDSGRPVSYVDLNRTGVPLMEIVSEPDLRSPEEAGAYLRKLRSLIRYLDIGDGNMEEGSFRCDANVSIRPKGAEEFGTRAEIKNLNSFKAVEKALYFEIDRQKEVLADGKQVVQETRLWDADKNRTFSMRGKEEAHDYRYFPDPDLLPLTVDEKWVESIKEDLPELPDRKKERFISELGLPEADADFLCSARETAQYFETCLESFPHAKPLANWLMGPYTAFLNQTGEGFEAAPIPPEDLADLLTLVEKGDLSGSMAKTVFEEMTQTGRTAAEIVEEKGLRQVSDESALEKVVDEILTASPDEVERYKAGNQKLMGFFVGRIMKKTKGKANPKVVNEMIRAKLSSE